MPTKVAAITSRGAAVAGEHGQSGLGRPRTRRQHHRRHSVGVVHLARHPGQHVDEMSVAATAMNRSSGVRQSLMKPAMISGVTGSPR